MQCYLTPGPKSPGKMKADQGAGSCAPPAFRLSIQARGKAGISQNSHTAKYDLHQMVGKFL